MFLRKQKPQSSAEPVIRLLKKQKRFGRLYGMHVQVRRDNAMKGLYKYSTPRSKVFRHAD